MNSPVSYLSCAVILSMLAAPSVHAQTEAASTEVIETCPMPERPSIPNGLKSSEEEMIAAQLGIKDYITKGEAVLGAWMNSGQAGERLPPKNNCRSTCCSTTKWWMK